jgi:hypothetical protein
MNALKKYQNIRQKNFTINERNYQKIVSSVKIKLYWKLDRLNEQELSAKCIKITNTTPTLLLRTNKSHP